MPSLLWFFPIFSGLLLGLLAAVLHELGHLLAARAVGVRVKALGFRWKGFYVVREPGTPAKSFLISLAGPFTNSVLILLWPISPSFGLANLCFAFFNLLPIEGSDGERAWSCWRAMRRERLQSSSTQKGEVRHSPQIGD
jgi:Zn-dependent protease